jgi:WD40 repeat protein
LLLAIERGTNDTQEVNPVAFLHDGTHVVLGSDDRSVRIWDASTGKEVQKLDGGTSSVKSVAFSHDGTRVVSGSCNQFVLISYTSTSVQL